MKTKIFLAALATALTATAHAQVKVEDAIKWRQSAYATMGWSMARIDSNLKGTYNKEEVLKAATVLQAIAPASTLADGDSLALLNQLSKLTGWAVPPGLAGLSSKEIRHRLL